MSAAHQILLVFSVTMLCLTPLGKEKLLHTFFSSFFFFAQRTFILLIVGADEQVVVDVLLTREKTGEVAGGVLATVSNDNEPMKCFQDSD